MTLTSPVLGTDPVTPPPEASPRLVPGRADLVDAAFVIALCLFALVGFGDVFGGTRWLQVGALGIVCGLLVAHLGAATRQLAVFVVLLALGVTALSSGLVLGQGVLPSTASARDMLDGGLRGWHDLLTILPPVGDIGNLLAVPFTGALAASLISYSIARRTRWPGAAVLPPAVLLIGAILVGAPVPEGDLTRLVVQGFAFAVLGLLWAGVHQRRALTRTGGALSARPVGVLLTVLATAAVVIVGLPIFGPDADGDRVVLRDKIVPPFDPAAYGSPLAGFRRFTSAPEAALFEVSGLPAGARVRQAVMDDYDGLVWNVSAAASSGQDGSGWFQRIATRVPGATGSDTTEISFTMAGLGGVWVPSVPSVHSVELGRDRPMFANAVTATVAVPSGLAPGDTWTEAVAVTGTTGPQDLPQDARTAVVEQPTPRNVPEAVAERAVSMAGPQAGPVAQIQALQKALQEGYYSDGAPGESQSASGHGAVRLAQMLESEQLNGNDEQYAALMALMLRALDIPARVVVGWQPSSGTVAGQDAMAWVEVPFDGVGWVTVDATPDHDRRLAEQRPVPPPRADVPNDPLPPPAAQTEDLVPKVSDRENDQPEDASRLPWALILTWVAGGLLVVALITAPVWGLLGLKARRRRLRRTQGDPSGRTAAGWRELLDLSADLGRSVPRTATRREQAVLMRIPGAEPLARQADQATFSGRAPEPAAVQQFWDEVIRLRSGQLARLGRRRRWWTLVNPASLRSR